MNLSSLGRSSTMMKGVSVLCVLAVVTIGMAGFRDISEPEDMIGKSDAELEALMDPLAEELALDHSRRALREYRASKGLFGCEGDCVDNKHRWLEAERDLLTVGQTRAAARKVARARSRAASSGVTVSSGGGTASLADRQAAAKARQAARAEKRRGISVGSGGTTSVVSPRAAAQARAAERKAARYAEKIARITASGGGGSVSAPVRMTPSQRQAQRQADRLAALEPGINELVANMTDDEKKANCYENQNNNDCRAMQTCWFGIAKQYGSMMSASAQVIETSQHTPADVLQEQTDIAIDIAGGGDKSQLIMCLDFFYDRTMNCLDNTPTDEEITEATTFDEFFYYYNQNAGWDDMCHRLVRTKAGMLIKNQEELASLEKAVKLAQEQYFVADAEMAAAKQTMDDAGVDKYDMSNPLSSSYWASTYEYSNMEATYYDLQKDLKNHGAPYW